jgi:membrane protein implicated in regulation of membrane protease activity
LPARLAASAPDPQAEQEGTDMQEEWMIAWGVIAALFVVVEVLSMAFVAIYIAIGAFAASMVALAGGNLGWQFMAFAVTGVVLMLLTRPFIKGRLESPDVATNVNRLVGKGGIVTIAIDNDANTGQIRVGTEYWTARVAAEDSVLVIPVESRVRVESVEGVTARVRLRSDEPTA